MKYFAEATGIRVSRHLPHNPHCTVCISYIVSYRESFPFASLRQAYAFRTFEYADLPLHVLNRNILSNDGFPQI